MNHYDELDQDVFALGMSKEEPGISLADATVFVHAMRKIAAGPGQPAPDADLAQHSADVATGEEATPDEAAAHTQAGAPDESGHLEGEFAVPVEQVVMTLAQLVSNSMRQHTAYAYYGEMMRDAGRGELAELFDRQSKGEINEMKYFLRRMSVLHPGGVPIPVAPTPEPSADVADALRYLVAGEQQAIVLFKTLHSMLGENPMKYTIESIMTDAQEHLDHLWQYMPATEAPTQQQAAAKVAGVIAKMKLASKEGTKAEFLNGKWQIVNHRHVGGDVYHLSAPSSEQVASFKKKYPKFRATAYTGPGLHSRYAENGEVTHGVSPEGHHKQAAPNTPKPSPGAVPVGAPGTEPLGAVLSREAMLQSAQLMAENQDLRTRLDAAGQSQLQAQQVIESLGAENENLQSQAQMSSDAAQQSTEMAQQASEQAAAQADAKMRLSIRIQQLRQNLADIVSQDPVQEEGVGFGEQAGPGTIATSSQQNQMAQEQAAAEQMAQEQEQAGQGGSKAKKETAQAQRAQQEAAQQTQQAATAQKTSGLRDAAKKHVGDALKEHAAEIGDAFGKSVAPHGEGLGHAMGRGMGQHFTEAGHNVVEGALAAGKKLLKNPKVRAGGGLAAAAYIGSKAYGMKKHHDREQREKKLLQAIQRIAAK